MNEMLTYIRKALLLGVIVALVALFAISTVQAVSVTVRVTCDPEVISQGGKTTITVTCSKEATGLIEVITPDEIIRGSVNITIPAGGSISKVYPDDFPGGSTSQVGNYTVIVSLYGQKFLSYFYVGFTVIPQTPLGVIGVIFACLSALGVKFKTKKK